MPSDELIQFCEGISSVNCKKGDTVSELADAGAILPRILLVNAIILSIIALIMIEQPYLQKYLMIKKIIISSIPILALSSFYTISQYIDDKNQESNYIISIDTVQFANGIWLIFFAATISLIGVILGFNDNELTVEHSSIKSKTGQ